MHEYSLVQALFDRIEEVVRERHAISVRRVRVQIGQSAGVDAGLFRTAYDTFRIRTICADAPLDVREVPVRWVCPDGHGPIPARTPLTCPACGRPCRLDAGDEIVLEQLELEVP